MATRTFHWYESAEDLVSINKNKWHLYLAKAVSTPSNQSGPPNVIWRSSAGAPRINITWSVQYAFNWTAEAPQPGVSVTLGGLWQAANKGEVWDIDSNGLFQQNTTVPGKAGWLSIGNVSYSYPDPNDPTNTIPIYIIVGIQNSSTLDFDPIYVDPTMMCLNSNGTYQPQEGVKAWLQSGLIRGQVYSDTGTNGRLYDYSSVTEWWGSFLFKAGSWTASKTAPLPLVYAPPPSVLVIQDEPATEVITWPILARATMKPPVAAAAAAGLVTYLKSQFSGFQNVNIAFTTNAGNEISFTYGPKKAAVPGTLDFIGVQAGNYTYPDVVSALTSARKQGQLPPNEKWDISGNEDDNGVLAPAANGEAYGEAEDIPQVLYRVTEQAGRLAAARA
jgi:hypothetical protein